MKLSEAAQAVEKTAKQRLARGSVDLVLPIYEGRYAGRFGVLSEDRLRELEHESTDTTEQRDDVNALFIADSCRVLLCRPTVGAPVVALEHDDGRPVLFDEDFAQSIGLEPAPGRGDLASMADVVVACWTVEEADGKRAVNHSALNVFANRLLDWMQDTTRRIEGELVGESNGTRQ